MIEFTFEIYYMDMIPDGDGDWQENERIYLGKVDILAESIEDIDDKKILKAVHNHWAVEYSGRKVQAFHTTDRRRVYAEDLYGDGTWWEVGYKVQHKPVLGLKLDGCITL